MTGSNNGFIIRFDDFCGTAGGQQKKERCNTIPRIDRRTLLRHWPGLSRPSTSLIRLVIQDVDARDKRGHDESNAATLGIDRSPCLRRGFNTGDKLDEISLTFGAGLFEQATEVGSAPLVRNAERSRDRWRSLQA